MIIFDVVGPLSVPFYRGKGGRTIRDEDVEQFWRLHKSYQKDRGCYVFSNRASKGYTPGYVGKATASFRQEVFAHHKLSRYQQFLADYAKGTPVLFLVIAPKGRGKPNAKAMGEVERYLINLAGC